MAATIPHRLFLVSGPAASGRVALTFDDGPDPTLTPRLLDRLKARNVPAAFFVVGEKAERHPEIIARMVNEGHDLGHHSFTHGVPEETSARTLAKEARDTARLLAPALGQRPPRLFRPPHGKLTVAKTAALWAAQQSIVLWNRDPKDFSCGSAETLRAWFATQPLTGGDILLLHDTHPHAIEALDAIVERVTAQGLCFGRVSDWVFA